jgi:deaminated glutathione amidase
VAPGEQIVVADTPVGGSGMSVCYDMRFPELYRELVSRGARVAGHAGGVHGADRAGALGDAAARARDREPVLRRGAGAGGTHTSGRETYGDT